MLIPCLHECSWSASKACPATSPPQPPPPPPPPVNCDVDSSLFKVNDIDICVPHELYPEENASTCVFDKTWQEVRELKGVMETGGLGDLLIEDEWEAWVCGAQLPCAIQAQDWVCYTCSEKHEVFVPWGYNRKLGLVKKYSKK